MKKYLTISVVIPVYNEELTIKRCLDAIAAQNLQPEQIVIVDNNCSDATMQIVKTHGNYTLVSQQKQGIGIAAATGYDAVTSNIIVRCDADSIAGSDWLERIYQQFSVDPDLDALTGPGVFYDAGRLQSMFAKYFYMNAYFTLVGLALTQPPLFGSNFAMRRSVWESIRTQVHAENNKIHDDIDLSYHLIGRKVIYDKSLAVGISARPFSSMTGMFLRCKRGFNSIFLHRRSYSFVALYRRKFGIDYKK